MELQQLKYFKTVAEVGKISAAAEALFISAPALSTAISRLEKELDMPLFDRTNNSIRLNRQGQIFLRYVNQVFANLESARIELRQSVLQQGQHVSVATMTSNLWIDLISAFSQEYPHFTLSCTSLRLTQFESSGLPPQYSFLLGEEIAGAPSFTGDLDSIPLFSDRIAVTVPKDHPLAALPAVSVEALMDLNIILPMPDYPLHERLVRMFAAYGHPLPNGNAYSSLVARHMVMEGKGISFSTVHTGRIDPEGLRCIPIDVPEAAAEVRLYWRRNREFTGDEQQFFDFVKALYRQDPQHNSQIMQALTFR